MIQINFSASKNTETDHNQWEIWGWGGGESFQLLFILMQF